MLSVDRRFLTGRAAALKWKLAVMRAFISLLVLLYMNLVATCAIPFQRARASAQGTAVLALDYSMDYHGDERRAMGVVAAVCFLLYALGVPLLLHAVASRRFAGTEQRNSQCGSLTESYRERFWWWELRGELPIVVTVGWARHGVRLLIWLLVDRLAVVFPFKFVSALVSQSSLSPAAYIYVMVALTVLFVGAHHRWRPLESAFNNAQHLVLLLCTLAVFAAALAVLHSDADAAYQAAGVVALAAVTCMLLTVVVAMRRAYAEFRAANPAAAAGSEPADAAAAAADPIALSAPAAVPSGGRASLKARLLEKAEEPDVDALWPETELDPHWLPRVALGCGYR